jgi:transcription factor MBP1
MLCRDVAVMRRRADGYLNATQILKVAGFDKPQRTRVLEREVQKGEHEKVQGGYGKYQGKSRRTDVGKADGRYLDTHRARLGTGQTIRSGRSAKTDNRL